MVVSLSYGHFFLKSIININLHKRKTFEIEKAFINTLSNDYKKFNFKLNELI